MEEVVVTGEYPGPGMWRVTSAEHPGHELWIVGEPPPLPRRLSWKSKQVERVLLQSQEVLLQPSVTIKPDEEIGLFKGLTLVPGLLKARKNPDGGKLQDHVPPESYARWLVQKRRYLGRDSSVEKFRPIVAAHELRKAAFEKLKLREGGMVWDKLGKLARKHQIPVNSPRKVFTFRADDARSKIRQFQREEIADADCFAKSLDLTEALGNQVVQEQRARAWATGDIDALASLPPLPAYAWVCVSALMQAQSVREMVPDDLGKQLDELWVNTAGELLAKNQTTLSVVSLSWLLGSDGLLAGLRDRGYMIEAPGMSAQ